MELSLRRYEENPLNIWREKRFFSNFERNVDHLFNDVFDGSLVAYIVPETRGEFSPRIDIKETHEALQISAEIPGMNQEDIDVSIHDGMLTISGEKKVEKKEEETNYHYAERSYGCFSREVSLPDTVDNEHIEAAYKNGVLNVRLPKTEKAMKGARKISVTAA